MTQAGSKSSGIILLAGRILLAVVFLGGLLHNLHAFSRTEEMLSPHLPWAPPLMLQLLLGGASAMLLFGVASLLLGWRTRIGALVLIAFLLLVTPVMHNFWAQEGREFWLQLINFQKNLSLLGGVLLLYAAGPGPHSLDGRRTRLAAGQPTSRSAPLP